MKRVIDSATTIFTYDGWRQIAEWNGSGGLVATNVYGIGIDEPLYRSAGSTQLFYKSDALGNVRFVLSNASTRADKLIEQYTYDAFGTPTIKDGNGNPLSGSAVGNRFMHKGREYLAALGLYDYRKRIYHPGLGKFLQTDPIGLAGDPMNLYRFCGHNPLIVSDPMGEDYISDLVDSPYADYVSAYPTSAYPSFYTDQGAWDTSLADVNFAVPKPWMPDATLNFSGTAATQIDNMGMWQGTMPGQAGPGIQPGAASFNLGTGVTTPLPSFDASPLLGASPLRYGGYTPINPFTGDLIMIPFGVSLSANIAAAEQANDPSLFAVLMGRQQTPIGIMLSMGTGGAMDYKSLYGEQYRDITNVNYGAVGSALRVPGEALLEFAGWYQEHRQSQNYNPADGHWYSGPPYGDNRQDQWMIGLGISIYSNRGQ